MMWLKTKNSGFLPTVYLFLGDNEAPVWPQNQPSQGLSLVESRMSDFHTYAQICPLC